MNLVCMLDPVYHKRQSKAGDAAQLVEGKPSTHGSLGLGPSTACMAGGAHLYPSMHKERQEHQTVQVMLSCIQSFRSA